MKNSWFKFTILPLLMLCNMAYCQVKTNATEWITVSEDETVTISYNPNITTNKDGNHFVWVKAVYHSRRWQNYFAEQINSREPIVTTKTKATYDELYNYAMVRQVQCFNKAGKKLYDSGDNPEGDWGPVNASDPIGIVGEFLGK